MFANLHNHTHFSLLDGLSQPEKIMEKCVEYGYPACAMTDHGSISGAVDFLDAAKKTKGKVKPILGNEFYVCEQDATVKDSSNRQLTHLCVLAKNLAGWKSLMKASNLSNKPEHYYYKPRLSLEKLAGQVGENCIAFSGHPGSHLANILFYNIKLAYGAKTPDQVRSFLKTYWLREAMDLAGRMKELFPSFYVEIQAVDKNFAAAQVIAQCLREVAQKTNVPVVATGDCHYVDKKDAEDHRILLCCLLKTNIKKIRNQIDEAEDVAFGGFFRGDSYAIPTPSELYDANTQEEVRNSLLIAEQCEVYSIGGPTRLPKFRDAAEKGKSEHEFLTELCRSNWNRLVSDVIPKDRHHVYVDRIKYELEVLRANNLSGYFCIVQDFCNYARQNNWLMNPGRGSAGGCLTSYLAGITRLDPIKYDLPFERFYNAGRNTPTKVSLPDIDCDFPKHARPKIIKYLQQKWGEDKVGHIVTFGRMQGPSALKNVLRANGACGFDEMNRITSYIPEESKIADELQEMDEPSIIRWALTHRADKLKQWCKLNKEGKCEGEYAAYFEQAIRFEGTKSGKGKHASGIIISDEPLIDVCPMIYDEKEKNMMCGLEGEPLEGVGFPKFDVLGVLVLDRLQDAISSIRGETC